MVRPRSLVIVTGPTASGKSALALSLGKALNAEIISCDSVQVYRGFDIGSAKPTKHELKEVKHHLIDCCSPKEQYNAAKFRADALEIINRLHTKNIQPIIVGGTTLYLSALLTGLSVYPKSDSKLRVELQKLSSLEQYKMLSELDPKRAAKLHPNDSIRIVRALEIIKLTGKSVSDSIIDNKYEICPFPVLVINLCLEATLLAERIDKRTHQMLADGLLDEVRVLLEKTPREAAAFQTVGYKEALQVLEGTLGIERLAEKISISTRQLAKRQRTFFRNEPKKRGWKVAPSEFDPLEGVQSILVENKITGRRLKNSQLGYLAYQLAIDKLILQVNNWLNKTKEDGVELWNVSVSSS